MNIISKLTLRHLMLNKKRTLVTIVGVIISVAMITGISTFSVSFLDFLRNDEMGNGGNWHALYKDAGIESVQKIKADEDIDTIAISKDIGYAYLEDSKNPNKPYLFIKAYNEEGFKNFNINILEGRLPKKSNEIVISQHIKDNAGVNFKIGEKLYLDIGNRLKLSEDMSALDQSSAYIPTNQDGNGEQLNLITKKEYVITGIISRPSIEPNFAPGYTSISYIDNNELAKYDNLNLFVAFKKVSPKLYTHAEELGIRVGVKDITYNNMLLRYYGITQDDIFLGTFYTFAAIMISIIMLGSISLIYNAFAISISERSRHLGMLASIGATKKQKRYSVFFEGLVVGIIGIPIGILFGTLGIGATFIFIQPLLEKVISGGQKLTIVISPISILVAGILSAITIFISCYIPAKLASKISPIDAVRQTQDIKLSSKVVRTSKLTRSIFGFEAELALKNLKRNNRRYRATIFSLVISIVLFLSISSFTLLSQKSTEVLQRGTINYDVGVTLTPSLSGEERDILYKDITSLENINEYQISETMRVELLLDENMVKGYCSAY